jgi:hypothetical protein
MRFLGAASTVFVLTLAFGISDSGPAPRGKPLDGREIFRFDTFGDEQLWTDTLRLHEAIETVTPATALAVGLKVDAEALPPPVIKALAAGQLDLNDPSVTRQLLKKNAVVGVVAKITGDRIKSIGITCALCHSTTTRLRRVSASAAMAGRTSTSMWGRSQPWLPVFPTSSRTSSGRGGPENTIRGITCSTGRT